MLYGGAPSARGEAVVEGIANTRVRFEHGSYRKYNGAVERCKKRFSAQAVPAVVGGDLANIRRMQLTDDNDEQNPAVVVPVRGFCTMRNAGTMVPIVTDSADFDRMERSARRNAKQFKQDVVTGRRLLVHRRRCSCAHTRYLQQARLKIVGKMQTESVEIWTTKGDQDEEVRAIVPRVSGNRTATT